MLTEVNKKERIMISKALEEYLKTMYILKKQKGDIRVTDIANKMNCSKPSVNKAINNLKDNNLQEIWFSKQTMEIKRLILILSHNLH